MLKAAQWCAPDSDPYYTSDFELGCVWDRQDSPRKVYADPSFIPSVDEDLQEDEWVQYKNSSTPPTAVAVSTFRSRVWYPLLND